MRSVTLSTVARLAQPLFSPHYLKEGTTFGGKFTDRKMCVSILSTTLFETFVILTRIQRDTVTNVKTSSRKVSVILVRF